MSQKPTKSPKRPILLVQTTKVNANKPLVTYSSATPRKTTATTKQTASSPFQQVPPINTSAQKQRQKEMMTIINSSQGIESPRSPRNSNQKTISPTSSSQVSPKKDSPDSLKRQIRDQSRHNFQQSQLIKKLHTDLVRAELVTGNSAPNSNPADSPNQFSNLASRLDFLVENYINQNEKLKKLEEGAVEPQSNAQLDDSMKRAVQADEICKRELGVNYTSDELSKALQNKQTIPEVSGAVSRDITSFANELDAELGKKLREIFNDNDNDSIVNSVNRLRDSAQSTKAAENIEVNDEKDTVQKLNQQHQQDIADKDEQIKQLSDEVSDLKAQNEKQNNDIQNLNITLDNNNKEHNEARENLERQLNQKNEELNSVYKQLEEKGIETDPQRRDRELSSRIREIFTNDQDEQIPGYVRKDVELASGIRGIFASGDDNYITESIKQLRQAAPQSQSQVDDLNRQISQLKEEIANKDSYTNQLKDEVDQKQHEIENQNNQINQLREESSNKDSYANQLKDEVEQKQREIENQNNQINQLREESSNKDSYANQLKDEVEQKQREIENQNNKHNNEVDDLKNIIKNKEAEIDNYVKSAPGSELIDNYRKEIENYKQMNDQLKQEREEAQINYASERNKQQETIDNLRKELDDLNNSSKAEIDSLNNQLDEKSKKQRELEDKINELSSTKENPNIDLQEFNEQLKKDLHDSQEQLKKLQEENSKKDDMINISKGEYDKLQQRLQDFIDNAGLTKQQATEATNKIIQLKQENEELRRQNKDFISDSEASLIEFKKQNEETVNFAGQCREVLPGDNDEAKLDNARLNTNLAEGVRRKLLHNGESGSPSIDEGLLNKIDDLINGTSLSTDAQENPPKTFKKDNLFESVTNIFHPDMSEDDIKNHTAKVANAAERFYNDENVKPALNSLFDKASGADLNNLVEQMRQDPNESIRKNAEILSDALKDDRMSVEAEGMIATTLAMFLAQIGNQQ